MTARERLVQSYVKLIKEGKATLSDVPKSIRNAVALALAEEE